MSGFLQPSEETPEARRLFDEDLTELGYVMNVTKLWAYQPDTVTGLFDLVRQCAKAGGLDLRTRGILVTACASPSRSGSSSRTRSSMRRAFAACLRPFRKTRRASISSGKSFAIRN